MKSRESSEIRSAIARQRAGVRVAMALRRAFDAGHRARLSGDSDTVCRLRRPDRRNAWMRGWQLADLIVAENQAMRSMTPEERARGLKAVAVLRGKLPFLNPPIISCDTY